jgi:hypothetical protein
MVSIMRSYRSLLTTRTEFEVALPLEYMIVIGPTRPMSKDSRYCLNSDTVPSDLTTDRTPGFSISIHNQFDGAVKFSNSLVAEHSLVCVRDGLVPDG